MKKLLISLAVLFTSQVVLAQNTSESCYRGFVDGGYTIGIGDYEFGRFEINTSHGYQINPFFFIGGGLGLHFMPEYKTKGMDIPLDQREAKVDIPVFANLRANFSKGKIVPFVDGKAGTYVTNNGGLYLNLSAGCRFAVNEKQAVNVSVGYTTEKLEFETFKSFISSKKMNYMTSPRKLNTEGIAVKVGYEF
jgi:hypothetical protein